MGEGSKAPGAGFSSAELSCGPLLDCVGELDALRMNIGTETCWLLKNYWLAAFCGVGGMADVLSLQSIRDAGQEN